MMPGDEAALTADVIAFATQYGRYGYRRIAALLRDAGYNGTNLLAGSSLSVLFNETGTSSLSITGGNFTSSDLGSTSISGNFQVDTEIRNAVSAIDTAINSVKTQATTFESNAAIIYNRQDFIKNMVTTLSNGADDLGAADINQSAAELLALQTRQQLALTTLSLTQSQGQSVLRLFGQ